ncbi:hypothetical protein [Xenorhabdus thuongxuanensis]|uniref:Uncharacterized protein n=1 Tax=Xenorhabdus thuongxuanensis TaxID=1873484 RepID=A0A1Q5TRI4_9GAMM|nr:hypothetical protein [Xenorhabdus thuongxuanensis]OKP02825.1 hypothetical protein Xentx_03101 [Xenorhabdus thuongxuanensis]
MIKIKENESMIQYLIGYLVTNTYSLDHYIHTQEFDDPNLDIPKEIKDIINGVIINQTKRIRILSEILDKRLYKHVLLFFSLSATAISENILHVEWDDFRSTLSNLRWNDANLCALDFMKHVINKGSFLSYKNGFFICQIISYEISILEVLNNAKKISYNSLSMSDSKSDYNYPVVMVKPVYNTYDFDIVTMIKKLRKNDNVEIELSDKELLKNEKNNILTYISWHDQKVRTIKVNTLLMKLINEFYSLSTYKKICDKILLSELSDNNILKIDSIFIKLESLGVIRWFSKSKLKNIKRS